MLIGPRFFCMIRFKVRKRFGDPLLPPLGWFFKKKHFWHTKIGVFYFQKDWGRLPFTKKVRLSSLPFTQIYNCLPETWGKLTDTAAICDHVGTQSATHLLRGSHLPHGWSCPFVPVWLFWPILYCRGLLSGSPYVCGHVCTHDATLPSSTGHCATLAARSPTCPMVVTMDALKMMPPLR